MVKNSLATGGVVDFTVDVAGLCGDINRMTGGVADFGGGFESDSMAGLIRNMQLGAAAVALMLHDWPYRLNIVMAVLLAIAVGAMWESRDGGGDE